MLIQFTTKNFLSYKYEAVFSMLASKDLQHYENTFILNKKHRLLRSAVIYGSNASGKSNLFKAISFMKEFVINSSEGMQTTDLIEVENFRLSTETKKLPSLFEIIFSNENIIFRYGFEVTKQEVVSEWLFASYNNREVKLFTRRNQQFDVSSKFKEGKDIGKKTRSNALFLSVVAQLEGEVSKKILDYFKKIDIISQDNKPSYKSLLNILNENKGKYELDNFIYLIKNLDIGIEDIKLKGKFKNSINNIQVIYSKFNNDKFEKLEAFDLNDESEGTKNLFNILGLIIEALQEGRILLLDEVERSFHPLLFDSIIKLIYSKKNQSTNPQLIFITYSTNMFYSVKYRRDQIWFVEKDKFGSSKLYSLNEFKEYNENDRYFMKSYLDGRYGAIPYINKLR